MRRHRLIITLHQRIFRLRLHRFTLFMRRHSLNTNKNNNQVDDKIDRKPYLIPISILNDSHFLASSFPRKENSEYLSRCVEVFCTRSGQLILFKETYMFRFVLL